MRLYKFENILNEIASTFDIDQWDNQNNIFVNSVDSYVNDYFYSIDLKGRNTKYFYHYIYPICSCIRNFVKRTHPFSHKIKWPAISEEFYGNVHFPLTAAGRFLDAPDPFFHNSCFPEQYRQFKDIPKLTERNYEHLQYTSHFLPWEDNKNDLFKNILPDNYIANNDIKKYLHYSELYPLNEFYYITEGEKILQFLIDSPEFKQVKSVVLQSGRSATDFRDFSYTTFIYNDNPDNIFTFICGSRKDTIHLVDEWSLLFYWKIKNYD